jgi:glycosyltransferase involved in cell wall biosynthesis
VKRVFIPFDLPAFKYLNSNHPLPASLLEPRYDGIEFVRARMDRPAPLSASTVLDQAAEFARSLRDLPVALPDLEASILSFVASRDLVSQARVDVSADLAFFHTAPVLLDQMPWLLHVESLSSMFAPIVRPGESGDVELRRLPIYWLVRRMLESERCRGVFTNIAGTKDQIDRVFDSEIIARKSRHIAPGAYFTPEEERAVAASFEARGGKKEVEILFTGSWHQLEQSFFLRGGHELVMAFLEIEEAHPDIRLILRTAWPEPWKGTAIERRVRGHAKITLLEEKLSDAAMIDLFRRADIFALDSASLHSISILRAMQCGAACIVSDIPGYEEYVDRNSAITLPGRRAAVYSEDPESGWLRDDCRSLYETDPRRVGHMAATLSVLCADPALRRRLGANARWRVLARNRFAGWTRGFETLMREALAAG